MRFKNYFEFLTRCRRRHPFSSCHLEMTSKTKLILQLKNYEKNRSSLLTVFASSNKVSIEIDWRFFISFFILTTNTKRLCHIFLVDFKVSESLGLQLKQKREHNIYLRIFWNPISGGEVIVHSFYRFNDNIMKGAAKSQAPLPTA